EFEAQIPSRCIGGIESLALDGAVHDRLWQVEREGIGQLRDHDESHNEQLFAPAVAKYVFEKIGFHDNSESRGEPGGTRPARRHNDRACSQWRQTAARERNTSLQSVTQTPLFHFLWHMP